MRIKIFTLSLKDLLSLLLHHLLDLIFVLAPFHLLKGPCVELDAHLAFFFPESLSTGFLCLNWSLLDIDVLLSEGGLQ
jgi:hypothetical protein